MTKHSHENDVAFIQALAELLNKNELTEISVVRGMAKTTVSKCAWPNNRPWCNRRPSVLPCRSARSRRRSARRSSSF